MNKPFDWVKANFLSLMIGALFLCFMGVLSYSLYYASPNIKAVVISFLGTSGIAIYANNNSRKREINARLFIEKSKAYSGFGELISEALLHTINKNKSESKATNKPKHKQEKKSVELAKKMMELKQKLIFWGGPEVFKLWHDYDDLLTSGSDNANEMIYAVEKVLQVMREDLGHDDSSLDEGDLFGLFLDSEAKKEFKNFIQQENKSA